MDALPVFPRVRLLRWWVPAAAVLLIAVGVLGILYEENLYRSEQVGEATVQADILSSSVAAALVFNDAGAAQQYADALETNPEIEAVEVYGASGVPVAGFVRTGAGRAPASAPVPALVADASRVTVTQRVTRNGMAQGTVYLRLMMDPFGRRLVRFGGILLLVTMALLVLAVSTVAQRALRRANERLSAQGAELADINRRLQLEMAERAVAEESLRQSQKMEAIGQLSGGIAHDLNNLLAIMQGNLQLARKRLAQGKADIQRYLDGALDAISRAASVTHRVLAFSRRQPLSPRSVSLNALLADMEDLLRHSVGERVAIELNPDATWNVWCDANQMETVVINLAINARDAMPDGGTLTISTSDRHVTPSQDVAGGEYVELRVADNGVGMSEDVRQRAVDPFFTTKPQGRGTGLGLSMVFGYVRQSNGSMRIDSEPGSGTVITILMPRYAAQASAVNA
ncbi:MAG TPA: ATP-binding protein [Micropepsaceae bacterium]|nr:ATP-binding protein [Micropepsaceae bacterium]